MIDIDEIAGRPVARAGYHYWYTDALPEKDYFCENCLGELSKKANNYKRQDSKEGLFGHILCTHFLCPECGLYLTIFSLLER